VLAQLAMIDINLGKSNEISSGIYRHRPRIYGRLANAGCSKDLAFIVFHPTNNFLGHYLIEPLERRGRAILALNTRYLGNDSILLMEQAIKDVGAGINYLRRLGYKRICMIGNSGGGALASLYQAQAEHLTIKDTPDGTPIHLAREDLPPADSIALIAAAPSRALTYMYRMDAAVIDELDPLLSDASLDIFDPSNGPPFSPAFVARIREAQLARNRRITERCVNTLGRIEGGTEPFKDFAFVIHRTNADPRHIDLTLDPNDRELGDARAVNYAVNALGRFSTMRSWLSQWSVDYGRATGPDSLKLTSVPVLLVYFTADDIILPSYYAQWAAAAGSRAERVDFKGVPHYPQGNPGDVEKIADLLVEWADRH
jgi:pimeloyl-ACP methyl ester carboxylesterase